MPQFLVHKETKREFEVVGVDKEKGTITLKGPNSEFTEPFDKDRFKANGYDLVTRDGGLTKKPAAKPSPKKPEPAMAEAEEDDDGAFDDHDD